MSENSVIMNVFMLRDTSPRIMVEIWRNIRKIG